MKNENIIKSARREGPITVGMITIIVLGIISFFLYWWKQTLITILVFTAFFAVLWCIGKVVIYISDTTNDAFIKWWNKDLDQGDY